MAAEGEFKSECLIQKLSVECAGMNENLRAASHLQLEKILIVLEECIKEGQVIGEIRQELDSRELARMVQAQLYGSFILGRLTGNGEGMKKSLQGVFDYIRN